MTETTMSEALGALMDARQDPEKSLAVDAYKVCNKALQEIRKERVLVAQALINARRSEYAAAMADLQVKFEGMSHAAKLCWQVTGLPEESKKFI